MRGKLKILILSEILAVYLVDRLLCLSVAVTGDRYCYIFGFEWLYKILITVCGKFAAVSHGIGQTGPWNRKKFAVKNCGP